VDECKPLLNGDTPYSVMFGPDKCGGTNKAGAYTHSLFSST